MISGIRVVLGSAEFGTSVSEDTAFALLDEFVELGGRLIDTANNYAYWHARGHGGDSEAVLGRWLAARRNPDVSVITKIGSMLVNPGAEKPEYEGLAPETVRRAADASLSRLGTDCIDVLLTHHDHPATPLLDMWTAFTDLVERGKVRKVGVSNYSAARLTELIALIEQHGLAPLSVMQVKYSIIEAAQAHEPGLCPPFDAETWDTLRRLSPDTIITGYSPLLGGLVYEQPAAAGWPALYESAENRRSVAEIQHEAEQHGVSPSAWVLRQIVDRGIFPITGTSKPGRLRDNLALLAEP
jgi:aryl-alcohol dehydrogenase-like predicted oxidoreductase